MAKDPAAQLLSDLNAAALFGISRATFWRRVADGSMPKPVKIGGATRWRLDELEAVIAAATITRDSRRTG